MEFEWTAVVQGAGRTDRTPTRSDETVFLWQLDMLLGQAAGYLEVSKTGSAYPLLTLSISEKRAVVHRFDDESTCRLLEGDGVVAPEDSQNFPVVDDLAVFTGEFISSADRASGVVRAFVQGADLDSLGKWERL